MISESALLFFIPSILLGGIGSLFLKKGAKKFNIDPFKLLKNHNLIIGVFLSVVSLFLYITSLKYAKLSSLFPMVSLTYVFIAILSAIFLKEKITLSKAIGIIFITLGCFLVVK